MPQGREDDARAFYAGLLGLREIEKPETLRKNGGCWFVGGTVRIHLGVEKDFRPARKAHPALRVRGYEVLVRELAAAGVKAKPDDRLEGITRCYIADPFGNRLELIRNGDRDMHDA